MKNSVAPVMIVCKKRYSKMALIAIETYLKYHKAVLNVIVDATGYNALSGISHKSLNIIKLGNYRKEAMKSVGYSDYKVFKYDADGYHDRAYSSLKPLIMDTAISDVAPTSKYVLSLDADGLFTGNILTKVQTELEKVHHKFDLYMVERTDPRMMLVRDKKPGSGFTLWKRQSDFIPLFKKGFKELFTKYNGGSQELIKQLMLKIPSMVLQNPLLHFVSPDEKNPKITDKEILKLQPAYIHLHGKDSYNRLLKFKKVFDNN